MLAAAWAPATGPNGPLFFVSQGTVTILMTRQACLLLGIQICKSDNQIESERFLYESAMLAWMLGDTAVSLVDSPSREIIFQDRLKKTSNLLRQDFIAVVWTIRISGNNPLRRASSQTPRH